MKTKKKLIDNKIFLFGISLLLAFFCWILVGLTDSSTTFSQTISGVPINLSLQSETFDSMGLTVVEVSTPGGKAVQASTLTVQAVVRGDKASIGQLRLQPSLLTATVQVPNSVQGPGTYDLKLVSATSSNTSLGNSFQVVGYTPETIQVKLERLESKTLPVELVLSGETGVPDNYMRQSETVTPSQVVITGPQENLDRVASVQANLNFPEELTQSKTFEVPLTLLDSQGEEVSLEANYLSLDREMVQVVISVLKMAELPLSIEITNLPSNVSISDFHYSMSNQDLEIAGPVDSVDRYQELVVGTVDLRELSPSNSEFTFDVELPSGFVNLENIKTITVKFDTAQWRTVSLNIDDISLRNLDSDYQVSFLTSSLNSVEFVGPAEVIETFTAQDVTAYIDLATRDLTLGQYPLPVTIEIPSKKDVWYVGEYSVIVQVTQSQEDNTESSE